MKELETGGIQVPGQSEFEKIISAASLQVESISDNVYFGEGHDWKEIVRQLQEVAGNLDIVLYGRNVPWSFYKRAQELRAEIFYAINIANQRERYDKILELEEVLRSETSDAGWRAYLSIDVLSLDPIVWEPVCMATCCFQRRHSLM